MESISAYLTLESDVLSCLLRRNLKINMSVNEAEALKVCDIYDWDGKGELDMYYFMDIFYDTGKKFAKFDEVIVKMKAAAAEPDNSGNYHDYVELCKLYDKNENGTMMLAELENILCNLADEVPKEDAA